jgi:hypothetical protein
VRQPAAFLAHALVIGVVFAGTRTAAALVTGTARSDPLGAFALEAMAGAAVGLWFEFLVFRLRVSARAASAILAWLLFANLLAVMIEGAAFEPQALEPSALSVTVLLHVPVAALVAMTAVRIGRDERRRDVTIIAVPRRSVPSWAWRYLGCALVYVVLYFVTGALNFMLITGPFYRAGVAGLVVPPPNVVLLVAAAEGLLFPLAAGPLSYALAGRRSVRAIVCGASLFVLGAIVPLILAPSLPPDLRVSSALEILFQKFPAGAAAAQWLGPRDMASSSPPVRCVTV